MRSVKLFITSACAAALLKLDAPSVMAAKLQETTQTSLSDPLEVLLSQNESGSCQQDDQSKRGAPMVLSQNELAKEMADGSPD